MRAEAGMSDDKRHGGMGGGGTVNTNLIAPNIIESVYKGRVTAEIAESVRSQLEPYLRPGAGGLCWLVNLDGVTGVDLASTDSPTGFYAWFHQNGGDRIAVVIKGATLRMVVSSLAFALGTTVRVFETRASALEHLAIEEGQA